MSLKQDLKTLKKQKRQELHTLHHTYVRTKRDVSLFVFDELRHDGDRESIRRDELSFKHVVIIVGLAVAMSGRQALIAVTSLESDCSRAVNGNAVVTSE